MSTIIGFALVMGAIGIIRGVFAGIKEHSPKQQESNEPKNALDVDI